MIHIISDLNLGFHEIAEEQLLVNPETKYIIVTGNVSRENKRAMLFVERLASANTQATVIYNYGLEELRGKLYSAVLDGFNTRVNIFKKSPINLIMPLGRFIDDNFDFFTTLGWPAYADTDFYQSSLIKKTVSSWDEEFWIDDFCVTTKFARVYSPNFVRGMIEEEYNKINNWLLDKTSKKKILVSANGPNSKRFLLNTNYSLFKELDLSNVLWISGGDNDHIDQHRISLPGKNRNRYISLDDFSVINIE